MIRVGTRINVRPHARKKQVWGKVVLERVIVILFVSVASGQSVEILFVFKSPFWTKKIQKCGILSFEKSPFSLYKQNK